MNQFHNHMSQVSNFNALSATHCRVRETYMNRSKFYSNLPENFMNLKSKHYSAENLILSNWFKLKLKFIHIIHMNFTFELSLQAHLIRVS